MIQDTLFPNNPLAHLLDKRLDGEAYYAATVERLKRENEKFWKQHYELQRARAMHNPDNLPPPPLVPYIRKDYMESARHSPELG